MVLILLVVGFTRQNDTTPGDGIIVNANKQLQTIEGFGVNINPDQWRDGNFKKPIDLLIDDLGCTQFRFDCYGYADWLDPAKRNKDGKYSPEYLKEIYTSPRFKNAWATFRYLNSKGVQPFFSVSGKIPSALGEPKRPTRLADFNGYAEMVVSLIKWARVNEKLTFSLFAPFNETDLSYPEGPGITVDGTVPAIKAVLKRMNEEGLSDVKIMVMDDNGVRFSKIRQILKDVSMMPGISKFAVHTYGIGYEQYTEWWSSKSDYGMLVDTIKNSAYKDCEVWLTEFGDLDQTGLVEFDFSMTATRRLMKCLKEGYTAAMFWDAADNYHRHDNAWSTYGLLKTDTVNWAYTPKQRFFALKQVYKYVKPGFKQIDISKAVEIKKQDVYGKYHDTLIHINMLAFVSPDKKDFTIVGINKIEGNFNLTIRLEGLAPETQNKKLAYYLTTRNESCRMIDEIKIKDGSCNVMLRENSIFTVTTLK